MRGLVPILVVAFALMAQAREALIEGGRSKNGRHEVHIVADGNREASNYFFAIYDTHSKKRILRIDDVGGIYHYEEARQRSKALWNDSSSFVVFTDSGTRHSQEIYLFYVSGGAAMHVTFPDYVQNALGRVGATETDLHCHSEPARWDGNQLHVFLRFSVDDADRGRVFCASEIVLECQDGITSTRLISVTKPDLEDDR